MSGASAGEAAGREVYGGWVGRVREPAVVVTELAVVGKEPAVVGREPAVVGRSGR